MPPTLAHAIDYVTNLYHQMKADAESFKQVESLKRREAYINTRLKNLDATFREAQDWHFKLIGAKEEGTLRAKYFESEVFNKIKSLYFDYSGDMNEALQKESGDLAKSMIAAENPCDIKLKPIQLPAFSGGYESWKPFYDLFVSLVHSNKSIPNIQKLHYLKASIHGEAARLLQHVSLEEKNYESAWCILTERYENKRVLVNMQLRILINQKNLTIETASGIKELLDTTTECIHSLRNLDIPVNTWDVILIYIICLKLPSSTQELWEEHLGGARNCAELSVFTKFLETRFRTLESVEQSKPAFKRFLNPVSPSPNFKFSRAFHTGQTPSNTFNNNSSNHTSGQNLSCRICGGNHIIRKCEKFLKMEIKNRFLKDFVPKNLKQNVCTETNLEIRKVQSLFLETSNNFNLIEIIIAKHSSLTRLIRVIAYTFRAVHNFQNKKCRNIEPVTPAELENASNRILKSVQNSAFCDEISKLLAKTQIPKQSSILTLNPFLDDDGLLRVGGRLQNSLLKYERRHPLIIPKKSHFTDLLILNAHIATSHGGPILVTEYLQNKYWIISAKNNIKRIIKNCIICFRFAAKEANQLMGNLPAVRVQIARPFFNTGVDYAGPIEIKAWKGRCNKMFKGYIAIFICLCTKAIHIELVSDLSTATFIAAFHRFTARRGICKNIYSDCGTNFVGADNVLTRERKLIQKQWSQQIADKLSSHGTHWHFNPPSAPHMGGIWESGVKSIKFHLKRIVGNSKLTFEEYATLLSQIEACLNSRPLCPKSPDPDDLSVLTPGHFLIMDTLNTPPEKDLKDIKLHNLDRWKYIQSLYQSFWDKWSTEYLSHLQKRPKWNSIHIDIKIGDIVLLKDERMPPTHWQIARVIEIHPGDDKLVRVVTVKTSNGTFKRPIKKLCILPIKDNFNSNTIEK